MTTDPDPQSPTANKHTAVGVGLNLLLLVAIGYGYWQSEDWKGAWIMVGVPIAVVTVQYAWHLVRSR